MIIDIIAALIITYGFYKGYSNGLIDTIVNTLSILVGLFMAIKFSSFLTSVIQNIVHINTLLALIISVLIIFFAVMLLMRFVADKMEDLLKVVKINFINQIAGGLMLGFVFTICIGLILIALTEGGIMKADYANQSTLYEYLVKATKESSWFVEGFKNVFSEFWTKFQEAMNAAKENLNE